MSDFDLGSLDAHDEAELNIRHSATNEPTTWVWTFFGPGRRSDFERGAPQARGTTRGQGERQKVEE
jgi:hypothetical protein